MKCFGDVKIGLALLIMMLLLPGCAINLVDPARVTITSSLAYEIPEMVDVTTVINVLEKSYIKTMRKSVTVEEPTSPPVATNAFSDSIILREKVTALEGLGEVVIPSIGCPGALASIHTFMPDTTGLRLIAGCVVASHSGTRIYLAEAATGPSKGSADGIRFNAKHDVPFIELIAEDLTKRLPDIHPLKAPKILVRRTSDLPPEPRRTVAADPGKPEEAGLENTPTAIAHALPLICFSPKTKGLAVRGNPGSDVVVATLDSELIVQEDNAPKNSFLHITTPGGRSGWVKRSEVRWTPCPIA